MKNRVILLVSASALLAACSAESGTSSDADPHAGHHMGPSEEAAREKREFVEVFANHFDAAECESSELIGTMRRTEPDGAGLYIRSYQTSAACAEELKGILETRNFEEAEAGRYVSEAEAETTERVTIRMTDDGSAAGVEWEVDTK